MLLAYACSSDTPYNYYYMDVSNVDRQELGKSLLIAKKKEDDIDLTECLPMNTNKQPCVVLFSTEYFKALRDLEDLKARLKACEAGN